MFGGKSFTEHGNLCAEKEKTEKSRASQSGYIENDEINSEESHRVLLQPDTEKSKNSRKKKEYIAYFLVLFIALFLGLLSFYAMGAFLAAFSLGAVAIYTLSGLSAFFSVGIEGHEYWESIVEAFNIIQEKDERYLKIGLAVFATMGAVGCMFLTGSQLIPTLAALSTVLGVVGFPILIWTIASIAAVAYFLLAFKALYDLFGKEGTLRKSFKKFIVEQPIIKQIAAVFLVVVITALIITATIITGGIWWHLVRGLSHVPWRKLALSISSVFTVIGQAVFSFCSSLESLQAILEFSKIWNKIKAFIKNANKKDNDDKIRWNERCFRWLCRAALVFAVCATFIAHLTAMAVIGSALKSMKIWFVTIRVESAIAIQETTEFLTDFNFVKESVEGEPEGPLPYITFLLVTPFVAVVGLTMTVAWAIEVVAWSFCAVFSNIFCGQSTPWKLSTAPWCMKFPWLSDNFKRLFLSDDSSVGDNLDSVSHISSASDDSSSTDMLKQESNQSQRTIDNIGSGSSSSQKHITHHLDASGNNGNESKSNGGQVDSILVFKEMSSTPPPDTSDENNTFSQSESPIIAPLV